MTHAWKWMLGATAALALAACGGESSETGSATSAESGDAASSESASSGSDAAPPVSAADAAAADGTITATFNGVERTWYITSDTLQGQYVSQSDWSRFGDVGPVHVTLFGHTTPTTVLSSREALMIDFSAWADNAERPLESTGVTYLSEGLTNHHTSDVGDDITIALDSLVFDGDTMQLSGTFSGTLGFRSMSGAEPSDGVSEIAVTDGRFSATIREQQD